MIKQAKWISAGVGQSAPCIVKQFNIDSVSSALLSITGLGYFIAKINGKYVTKDLFNPVFSNYRERNFTTMLYPLKDEMTSRTYYCNYDVTQLLKQGVNTLEVYLGNGWYNQDKRTAEGHLEFGKQLITKFCLAIVDSNGTQSKVLSDGSEKWRATEVVENNLFYGETQDAHLKHQPKVLHHVVIEPEFETIFTLQTCPAETIVRKITPTLIAEYDGKKLYDVGETVSGWVKVLAKGKSGDVVKIYHADTLDKNGKMCDQNIGGQIANDKGQLQKQVTTYILDGRKRYYTPRFCKQAFRYFEVEGEVISLKVEVVHTKLPERTTFYCDNDVLNWLYDAYKRTQAINMHDGMPSDCPHRERLGYTGDGQITASSTMTFFESDLFYRKWIQDIIDCQDVNNGHVQHTAPFYGGGGGPVGWGGAIVQVPYAHYMHYGYKSVIENALPSMLKWVEYITNRTEEGLVCKEEDGGWCLGDWSSVDEMVLPQEFVNSTLFVQNLNRLCYLAEQVGQVDKVDYLQTLAEQYKKAIVQHFFDANTNSFCNGAQGADAFALSIGLGNEQTHQNLVEKYTQNCYFDTGFLGTYQLIEYLVNSNEIDLAFELLSSTQRGSFGYLQDLGYDCICEILRGIYGSFAHPMFGGVTEFLMHTLLGLPVSNVDTKIVLKPRFPSCVNQASGSTLIAGKKVKVFWQRKTSNIFWSCYIPKGIDAELQIGGKITKLKYGRNTIKTDYQGVK